MHLATSLPLMPFENSLYKVIFFFFIQFHPCQNFTAVEIQIIIKDFLFEQDNFEKIQQTKKTFKITQHAKKFHEGILRALKILHFKVL